MAPQRQRRCSRGSRAQRPVSMRKRCDERRILVNAIHKYSGIKVMKWGSLEYTWCATQLGFIVAHPVWHHSGKGGVPVGAEPSARSRCVSDAMKAHPGKRNPQIFRYQSHEMRLPGVHLMCDTIRVYCSVCHKFSPLGIPNLAPKSSITFTKILTRIW